MWREKSNLGALLAAPCWQITASNKDRWELARRWLIPVPSPEFEVVHMIQLCEAVHFAPVKPWPVTGFSAGVKPLIDAFLPLRRHLKQRKREAAFRGIAPFREHYGKTPVCRRDFRLLGPDQCVKLETKPNMVTRCHVSQVARNEESALHGFAKLWLLNGPCGLSWENRCWRFRRASDPKAKQSCDNCAQRGCENHVVEHPPCFPRHCRSPVHLYSVARKKALVACLGQILIIN